MRLAVLFGLTATKRRHAGSDVDLGVLLDPDVDLPALGALERAIGARVDLVPLEDAPPLLRFEIARDGVRLVARDAHEWPEFRARAMIDWWDWAPTARMMHRVMAERLREPRSTRVTPQRHLGRRLLSRKHSPGGTEQTEQLL